MIICKFVIISISIISISIISISIISLAAKGAPIRGPSERALEYGVPALASTVGARPEGRACQRGSPRAARPARLNLCGPSPLRTARPGGFHGRAGDADVTSVRAT